MADSSANVTRLLRAAASGERRDVDALLSAIYDDLRRLAAQQMRGERENHTLNPTALVHEAYVRLIDQRSTDWSDRLHFFAVAARVIRRVLVDHARTRDALKRGGDRVQVPLDAVAASATQPDFDVLALDEVMCELAEIDARQAQIVELRFYGGLSVAEVGEYLAISERSVDRDWACAKAWLYCRLTDEGRRGDAAGEPSGG